MTGKIRRFFVWLLAALLVLSCAGCTKDEAPPATEETLTVYATFYPLYALAEMINADIEGVRTLCLVQPQDGCLRNYELSDWDLALLLRSANAVIAGGRGLESFENTLFALGESGPAVTAVLYNTELANVQAEGVPEGETSHWDDPNPHLYMSIDGAVEIAGRISGAMQAMDPRYAENYSKNCKDAVEKLLQLEAEMHEICADAAGTKVALLNEACYYFAEMFDLNISLCYHRESGEDIDNMEALLESLRMSGSEVVLIEKQAPYALCKAIEDAGFSVAKIDVLSTRRENEGAQGYFDAQTANAHALKAAIDGRNATSQED